ncbi:hypothetical protein WDV76_08725 [Xenorhabdus griffiniae]|uniref:hypothetical protein n=1 Tax=Xenorhabdus griffiniae TaxID=351672 RepID=UPI0030CB035E
MTTVAWDGISLASDSQSQTDNLICSTSEQKIYTPENGDRWAINDNEIVAIGTSGDCGAEDELIDKLRNGINYNTEFSPLIEFYAIAIVCTEHAYLIYKNKDSTHASISKQREPIAIGSGGVCARAAMQCGKNAIDAVEIAKSMDVYSGGETQVFRVK